MGVMFASTGNGVEDGAAVRVKSGLAGGVAVRCCRSGKGVDVSGTYGVNVTVTGSLAAEGGVITSICIVQAERLMMAKANKNLYRMDSLLVNL